ncbi:MAG: hypothetical protein KF883_00195 [Thermomicrobiales bacterium]|nr:hypothetical protein [Thermomicrobiales bacterium]
MRCDDHHHCRAARNDHDDRAADDHNVNDNHRSTGNDDNHDRTAANDHLDNLSPHSLFQS